MTTAANAIFLQYTAPIYILLLGYFFFFVEGWSLYKYILQVVVIIMLAVSMIYSLYIPYRVRKIFAQQKELHLPLKMEFSEEGIRFENANSQGIRKWDVFLKWKENQNMMMLYLSDVMFMMLPRRMLTQEIIGFVHEQLKKNKIPEK